MSLHYFVYRKIKFTAQIVLALSDAYKYCLLFRCEVLNGWSHCTTMLWMVSLQMRWVLERLFRQLPCLPTLLKSKSSMDHSLLLFLSRKYSVCCRILWSVFLLFYFYWSFLICVIYRTLSNWLLEFEKWTPSIIVVSYKVRLNFSKTSGYPTVGPVWSLNPQTRAWQSTVLQPERFRWLIIQLMFSCRVHPTCVVQLHLKSGEESSMLYLLLMSMWWKTNQSSQR